MESHLPAWIQAAQGFGWHNILQVTIAAVLGGLIGLEREARGREAGFRTNMLIAIGACLFTILSIQGFPLQDSASRDTARIAAQVVSGVGFLGAGALFRGDNHIKGMTTAATIWLVAAIGMTVGVGAYGLAVFTSLLTFVVLRLLRPVSKTVGHWKQGERADFSDEQ
jgi:putative Mg2+ transporter-C (MgtC) family protein